MRNIFNKAISILFIILISITFITGCTTTPTGRIVDTSKEPIKFGVSFPMSGDAASWGQNAVAGIKLALSEIDYNIDGRPVELVIEDDQCSSKGVNAYTKLINVDKVTVIMGSACSAAAGPAVPIAQQNGVPVLLIASAPGLTAIGDYIFRIYPSDAFQGKIAADFMLNKLRKDKVAVVYVMNDWGEGLSRVFQDEFTRLGGEIVYSSGVNQQETDFRTELQKIKSSGAEAVYLPVYVNNGIAITKQMKESGFNLPVVGGDILTADDFVNSPYSEGIMFSEARADISEDFKTRIKAQPGYEDIEVNVAAPYAYDMVKVYAEAIRQVGTDRKAIKDYMAKTTFTDGVTADKISFDQQGDLERADFVFKVIKDNKKVEIRD